MDKISLTAPCGLDCFNCRYYQDNISEEITINVAMRTGLKPADVPCKGCREQKGHAPWNPACATFDCIQEKGFKYCYECKEFPCQKLMPASDGAEKYPHNLKLYNLSRMKSIGVERWTEEAFENRQRYFNGKFKVGEGPKFEK